MPDTVSGTIPLRELAFARSGDKGDTSNVAVIPYEEELFAHLSAQVTAERVAELFPGLVLGPVHRYELPGIKALNFVMERALGGGVSRTLALDAHGKAYANLVLTLEVDAPPAPEGHGEEHGR